MTIYQLLTADWRIRLLAQLTCAPRPLPRPTSSPTNGEEVAS
ncbi:hypothetical protein [Nocardioides bizhenqiangii]|uniref:Transcriptional regulator n=1 Tax=Nocardioides bizhenqiangii TaxID=3095076 RepID=A0ABZ0ZLQ0_9ACTN|nr:MULTISPECIES: hypothetical protein [unclassified Nocardioides]MDZ5620880.1 hypothetical protein [Nocardioides sp. HM23]WQQ25242.1 hypothetical protein SHK19_14865 [Nocardioides sp. HM61]